LVAPRTIAVADDPAQLDITTPDLVFPSGIAPQVKLTSNRDAVTWAAHNDTGGIVGSGVVTITGGTGEFSLTQLPVGYYTLHLATAGTDPVSRDTSFAVLGPQNDAAQNGQTPFSVSWHSYQLQLDQLGVMDELGVGSVRFDVKWDEVEKAAGVYQIPAATREQFATLTAAGLRPLVILDYRNPLYDNNLTPSTPEGIAAFAAYAAYVVSEFGTAADYEIYNEFNYSGLNNGLCGLTADCYVKLLEPTRAAIKAAVPDATVVGPVLSNTDHAWLTRFFELGGLDLVDVVSVHSYEAKNNGPEGITHAAVADIKALIRAYNGGKDKPLWISETGWTTYSGGVTEDQQADFLVRDMVLNIQAGVAREYWYDLVEDGPDGTKREHRWGLLRTLRSGCQWSCQGGLTTAAPKPAFVSYAMLTRKLAGATPVRMEPMADGAYSALFRDPNGHMIRVMWATTPQQVQVNTSGLVSVTTRFGRSTTTRPDNGTLTLDLTEHPIYLAGSVLSVSSIVAASSVYGAALPTTVTQGDTIDIPVTVDLRKHPEVAQNTVTFTAETGEQIRVPATPGQLTVAHLSVTAPQQRGTFVLAVHASVGGQVVAQFSRDVTVVGAAAQVSVSTAAVDGVVTPTVTVTNTGRAVLLARHLDVTLGAFHGTAEGAWRIAPGASLTVPVPVVGPQEWRVEVLTATATFDDGLVVSTTRSGSLAPVLDDSAVRPYRADLGQAQIVTITNDPIAGPSDLSGTMWVSRQGDALVVHATVIDNMHSGAATSASLWDRDSIQFGFTTDAAPTQRYEFGAALLQNGAAVLRGFAGVTGEITTTAVSVDRDEAHHLTRYRAVIPFAMIGLSPTATGVNFSLLVNDADAGSRKGWMEWASGIGRVKDTSRYVPLIFVPA